MHSHFNLNLFPNCLKIAGFEIADEVDRPKIGYFEAQVYVINEFWIDVIDLIFEGKSVAKICVLQ